MEKDKLQIRRMDIEHAQKMSDKDFDVTLTDLVGVAVQSGVKPVVIVGILEMVKDEVLTWNNRNLEAIRKKAQESVDQAHAEVVLKMPVPNGKISEIITSSTAPGVSYPDDN